MAVKKWMVVLAACLLSCAVVRAQQSDRTELRNGWELNSFCKVKDGGEAISSAGYKTDAWYHATVPTTVLAAQLAAGEFGDPYFGMNLRKIPGTSYKIGELFSREPMPADSPYACSWWYRTTFSTPAARSVALHFDGINYRANIWLNGQKIADAGDVAGAYRTYAFDIGSRLAKEGKNTLAVEVFAPSEKELGINWVDWNPAPPDKDMGLWGKVYLVQTGGVEIRYPAIATHFTAEDLSKADLTFVAELHNALGKEVSGELRAEIRELDVRISKRVTLAAGETRSVTITPEDAAALRIAAPEPWWPAQMGRQRLYQLRTEFLIDGAVADHKQIHFGVREITSELTPAGARLFRVNGKPILIRGGGWAPDMMLRSNAKRLDEELTYVREMNLNTIRLEGKIESDGFFDRTDQAGILVMAGWCCCDIWEKWDKWQERQLEVATASVRSQILRMRSHPSMLVWLNGSDNPPPAEVEKAYIQALTESSWPNPYLSSASATPASVTGKSGVKMSGPYDYVPPAYWELDKNKEGGAFGFNTETSPGAALPVKESLQKFLPAESLWPPNGLWNYHAAGEGFQDLKTFEDAMTAEYGAPKNLDDYEAKAQAMAYDGERAMFEAYSRNKYTSTGVIQWMLNNAWPSTYWHLYDYYLQPAGGYFGTKKANAPLHIQYGYDDHAITVVNSTYKAVKGLRASVRVYDFELRDLYHHEDRIDVDADGVQQVVALPEIAAAGDVYFVRLDLADANGKPVDVNFYWLSTRQPEFAWEKTTYKTTPTVTHPELTRLATLPQVKLDATAVVMASTVRVRLRNPSRHLAFQVVLAAKDKNGAEALPAMWEDNYISLLPGETREVIVRFPRGVILGPGATLDVSGWNIAPEKVALTRAEARQNAMHEMAPR